MLLYLAIKGEILMIGDTEIIKISSVGTIKLPSFIEVNTGETVYFRKDFYDDTKFMILDHENLCRICNLINESYKEKKKINYAQYNEINRFIFPAIRDSICKKDRIVKFPFESKEKEFKCTEVHTKDKVKKFILTPMRNSN